MRRVALLAIAAATCFVIFVALRRRWAAPAPLKTVRRPTGIIIHHSASGAEVEGKRVDASLIDVWHARRGFHVNIGRQTIHVGYHYIILPDGTIQNTRPEFLDGAHAKQFNDRIGICLVGNFSSHSNARGKQHPARPTGAQWHALIWLISTLLDKYDLPVSSVIRHCDTGAHTECPGDRLPFQRLLTRVTKRVETVRATRARTLVAAEDHSTSWRYACGVAVLGVCLLRRGQRRLRIIKTQSLKVRRLGMIARDN